MDPKATSEAAAPAAQEKGARGVPAGTNPPAPSGTPAPAVQEQTPSGASQIDIDQILQNPEVAEHIRRRAQGEADKRIHNAQMQYEEQQRAERERQQREASYQALETLDDEELGRQRRREIEVERQSEAWLAAQAPQVQRQILDVQRQNAQQFVESWLAAVPEKKAREEIRQQLEQGKYAEPPDFTKACAEARDAHQQAKLEERIRKEAHEASHKDATARLAGTAVPDLASGQPVGGGETYRNPQERIAAGIAKRMAEMQGG